MTMNDGNTSKEGIANVFASELRAQREKDNKNDFFSVFKNYFKDRTEFKSLLDNFKKDDKDKIIEIGSFYHWATQQIRHPGIILISIFSIMEAIQSLKEAHLTFDQWMLSDKESKDIPFPISKQKCKKAIRSLQKQYYLKHGASRKVRNFINQYFTQEDKTRLVQGFLIHEHLTYNSLGFDGKIKDIIDMLYNERSAFVHNAQIPQISKGKGGFIGYFKVGNKKTFVRVRISIGTIQKMFEKAFIKYLKMQVSNSR